MSGTVKIPNNIGRSGPDEIRFSGRPVSRGLAYGKIVSIHGDRRQYFRLTIDPQKITHEQNRVREALIAASNRIDKIGRGSEVAASGSSIFESHRAILDDPLLLDRILKVIETLQVNAEWAVGAVAEEFISQYRASSDEQFRDRALDLEDVAEYLLSALNGDSECVEIESGSIVAAKQLRPATLVEIARWRPVGLLTENGGWTSHSFILARELEIPAITGLHRLMRRVRDGDSVFVDAYIGEVVLHPTEETINSRRKLDRAERRPTSSVRPRSDAPQTLDGREIVIRANFDLRGDFRQAYEQGARGIGLFRSEYLMGNGQKFPDERQQFDAYRKAAQLAGIDRARIRTFDLSVGQVVEFGHRREQNPALGLRAIRLSLFAEHSFRTQLRALLRAAAYGKIDVILPMVTGVDEVRRVRELLDQECSSLRQHGIEYGSPRLGAMIEIPSAVLAIDQLVEEVDCISLGTNDLVQYLLGVDRDTESVASWFRTLHPSVLRAIKLVIKATDGSAKPVVVCGEMAGSPFYVPILLGLGARELSMNVNSIQRVKKVIEGIALEEARELVDLAWNWSTADEVEHVVENFILDRWKHLFEADLISGRKV